MVSGFSSRQHGLLVGLALVGVLGAGGACADSGPTALAQASKSLAQSGVTLVNALPDSAAVFASDVETVNRLDLVARAPVADLARVTRVLAPGDSLTIATENIPGYRPGASIRFNVYRVTNGVGVLDAGFTLTTEELAARKGRVEVSVAALTRN